MAKFSYSNLSTEELEAIFDAVEYRRIGKERAHIPENITLLKQIASDVGEELSQR